MTERNSWKDRLFGGFSKTSSRLTENLAGLVTKAKLDEATLDDIEDALIMSDLGPATAASIRKKLAVERFEKGLSEHAVKEIIQREITTVLEPVAIPLEIDAFPRPQVILVIGVNGSGKTTTIAKLAHL
ncbi:MAG: signal recognition particle receptor subunit alpha, partial [Sphingomonadales bacterium]|nr:signal recognition particle receptor subunit alpha [Sphingomonadales bacterium]